MAEEKIVESKQTPSKVKIVVAVHKRYPMPEDAMYLPLWVGAEGKEPESGYARDNTGQNISSKNAGFCELTGLYWAWKNLDAEYIGLVHYRRHFGEKSAGSDPLAGVLTYGQLEPLLGRYTVFVPKKRRYYIETLYSHYAHTFYAEHLDLVRSMIEEGKPEYLAAYDKAVRQTSGYMFNMLIIRRDHLDRYCEWLFDLLFELEQRLDTSGMTGFHARLYGRVSEILFNVWLEQMIKEGVIPRGEIKELDYFCTEKVDWWKKGRAFLGAKFLGKKYEESF